MNTKKKSLKTKKVNPFELKFNKAKHDVLGKKKNSQVGAPTASRKRAFEQREKTLGVEYDRKNKISKIVDKRIGEKDQKTEEEKGAMRFKEERVKNFKRASKFNLSDGFGEDEEEILTHHGKALSDIEKYDKTMISDSDDDDDNPGNIGSRMVKVAHFGGGEKSIEERVKEKISRDDMISNLIAKTKLARHEKQTEKDEIELKTETLDAKFQSIMSKIQGSFRPIGRNPLEKDDYDKLAFTLKVEADARATPADKKLSENEEALKEKERLEALESARISKSNSNFNCHLSADADVDINAGFKADERKKKHNDSRFEVRFADGKLVDEENKSNYEKIVKKRSDVDEDSDEDIDEEEDDEDDEDMDDLIEDEDELEDSDTDGENKTSKNEAVQVESSIPFVFELPKNYKRFCNLLEKYSNAMEIVLERLIKCYHPSLKEGNKSKLNKLFLFCLRWYDDMGKEDLNEQVIKEMNIAQFSMHSLLKFDVQYGVRCVRALIRQYWKTRQDKLKTTPASFSLICLLKLVAGLFPVGEAWHPVCTPAFFLGTNVISNCKIPNLKVLSRQILLAATIVEYVSESKRYVPELISFAKSALLLAVKDKPEEFPTSGFPISVPYSEMLCVDEKNDEKLMPLSLSVIFEDEKENKNDENLKLAVLRALFSLVQSLRVLYSSQNENYNILFRPFLTILTRIEKTNFSNELKDELETLISSMRAECESKSNLVQISLVKTEKSMLKMLEPRFEWDFDPERPHKGKRDEKKKIAKQLKNETRGAMKELRKDSAFLARKQLHNVKAKDRARISATKRLMGGLMEQQGEWNKELRTKDVESKKAKK